MFLVGLVVLLVGFIMFLVRLVVLLVGLVVVLSGLVVLHCLLEFLDVGDVLVVFFQELLDLDQEGGDLVIELEDLLLQLFAVDSTVVRSGFLQLPVQILELFVLLEETAFELLVLLFAEPECFSQGLYLLFALEEELVDLPVLLDQLLLPDLVFPAVLVEGSSDTDQLLLQVLHSPSQH